LHLGAFLEGLELDDEVVVVRLLVAQVPLDRGPLHPQLLYVATELGHLHLLGALGGGASAPLVTRLYLRWWLRNGRRGLPVRGRRECRALLALLFFLEAAVLLLEPLELGTQLGGLVLGLEPEPPFSLEALA
jgi:hypothetical protein